MVIKMEKSKLGVVLPVLAGAAFLLALFGHVEGALILLIYAIVAEKDDWLIKQSVKALFFGLFIKLANLLAVMLFDLVRAPFRLWLELSAYNSSPIRIINVISSVQSAAAYILQVVFVLIAVYAFVWLMRGKNAFIPGLESIADKTVGLIKEKKEKKAKKAAPAAAPTPPAPPPKPPAAPVQPAPSVSPPPPPAAEPIVQASPQLKPEQWLCACGAANEGNFCAKCGAHRPQ